MRNLEKQKKSKCKLTDQRVYELLAMFWLLEKKGYDKLMQNYRYIKENSWLKIWKVIWAVFDECYSSYWEHMRASFKSILWWLLSKKWKREYFRISTSKELSDLLDQSKDAYINAKIYDQDYQVVEKLWFSNTEIFEKFIKDMRYCINQWMSFDDTLTRWLSWWKLNLSEYYRQKFKSIFIAWVRHIDKSLWYLERVDFIEARLKFIIEKMNKAPKELSLI